jgi:transposase InsO family protein
LECLLVQSPVVVRGFHSDNGSEFVNRVMAELLYKLLIEFTKSRPRRTNDQPPVEMKNGSAVGEQMGHA